MPELVKTWRCRICKTVWPTHAAAQRCESRGNPKRTAKVGDIVLGGGGFGWYDGDRKWVRNPTVKAKPKHGNCFSPCCTLDFYYVVTAVDADDRDGHRARYHLFTKAMSGKQGYRSGYTFDEGHRGIDKAQRPPRLDTADLIGKKAEGLL